MSTLYEILDAKKVALIGSSPENDVVFNDAETSAHHCQISKIAEGQYLIVDLNSSTGTFINNKKIEKEFISDTDFITVGNNIFQLSKKINETIATKILSTEPIQSTQTVTSALPEQNSFSKSGSATDFEKAPNSDSNRSSGGSQKTKISVYFLSAPEDEAVCKAIDKHVSTIRINSPLPIEIKGDFKIPPGENISNYKQQLFEADIVLAFISVDFLNNDECYERIKKVIANHNNHKTILLPILARNCMWKATPFANLPLLPKNQQPLNNKQYWNSEDDALTEVVNDIYKSINEFTHKGTEEKPVQQQRTMPKLEIDWRKNYLWTVFWKRVVASILDGLIIGLPLYLIFYFGILSPMVQDYQAEVYYYGSSSSNPLGKLLFYYVLLVGIQIVIYAFMESSQWRGTPGKLIMKLQITDNAGNPITFGKSVIRNVIKLLISAFSGIGDGILLIIYIVAQIVNYARTKKFFHDQLSNTVIGERLK